MHTNQSGFHGFHPAQAENTPLGTFHPSLARAPWPPGSHEAAGAALPGGVFPLLSGAPRAGLAGLGGLALGAGGLEF